MNDDELKKLIGEMVDEVDTASENGDVDRHYCQMIAEKYMKIVYGKK